MRPLASLTAALAVLALAAPAHAREIRWPWEAPPKESDRDHRDRDDRGDRRQPPLVTIDREYTQPWSSDTEFTARMLENVRMQQEIARVLLDRSNDPAVRSFARRTLDETGTFEETLLTRARELSFDVRSIRPRPAISSDLDALRLTLDVIAADRPYFADYKSRVGGPFHSALARHWDDMVWRREEAKRLHDQVRNANRHYGS